MGLAFGYFNGFWWFFCFKNSGFVFNERVESCFYDKRIASHFFHFFHDIGVLPSEYQDYLKSMVGI
jgi:hypothetical protein